MPTKRFLNLPAEKKQALTRAAIREFARVSVQEASINRIVREAGVSRGSFYTYFEDKEDLLQYLLEEFRQQIWQRVIRGLKASGGDLFDACLQAFDGILAYCGVSDNREFFQRLFSEFRITRQDSGQFLRRLAGGEEFLQQFLAAVDVSRLRLQQPEDLLMAVEMVVLALEKSLALAFFTPGQEGAARAQLLRRLNYLRYGMMQEDGKAAE